MRLISRSQRACWLVDHPVFMQRILDRVNGCQWLNDDWMLPHVDLKTDGYIHEAFLQQLTVVRTSAEASWAARVVEARSRKDQCRLTLHPWMCFFNRDSQQERLPDGIHLWVGSVWRDLPFPSTA